MTFMHYRRPLGLTGWKLIALVLIGAVLLMLLASALFVLGMVLSMALAVAALHLLALPRLARRLRVSPLVLDGLLLPILLGVGWFFPGGWQGLLVALFIWIAGVAVPIYVARRLRHRLSFTLSASSLPMSLPGQTRDERVLEPVRCAQCGRTIWTETPASVRLCPDCGAPVARQP